MRKFGEDKARLYAEAQEAGISEIQRLAAAARHRRRHRADARLCLHQRRKLRVADREGGGGRAAARPSRQPDPRHRPALRRAARRCAGTTRPSSTRPNMSPASPRRSPATAATSSRTAARSTTSRTGSSTDAGTVRARHVVMATHLPLGQVGIVLCDEHADGGAGDRRADRAARCPECTRMPSSPAIRSAPTAAPTARSTAIVAGNHYKPGHTDGRAEIYRRHRSLADRAFRRRPGRISLGQRGLQRDRRRPVHRLVVEHRRRAIWSPPASPPGGSPTARRRR